MAPVIIIGMGMSSRDLTREQLDIIQSADILVGGQRHLNEFEHATARKKPISRDIPELIDYIRSHQDKNNIVVLASGDPLFYGIGSRLLSALGTEAVAVYPNISSVAAAFARIKTPWHDAAVVSLHGKAPDGELNDVLRSRDKIAVLTDPHNTPSRLAGHCLKAGYAQFDMCVLEKLGSREEAVGWYSLPEAAAKTFSQPNLVILKRPRSSSTGQGACELQLGMPETEFEHRAGLITKAEIRAVILSKLRLKPDHVLWDLGAGSGSVAVEAALFVRSGQLFAVEKHPQRLADIRANARRFDLHQLTVVEADLPDGLADLPAPDRVFIGGGGRKLAGIIRAAADRIKPGGILVVNTVLLESLQTAAETLEDLDFRVAVTQIQVNRSRCMPWGRRLEAENPVFIVEARRKDAMKN